MLTCDRCRRGPLALPDGSGATAGWYDVRAGGAWASFARSPGEAVVCDACMWRDPRYVSEHGQPASPAPLPVLLVDGTTLRVAVLATSVTYARALLEGRSVQEAEQLRATRLAEVLRAAS